MDANIDGSNKIYVAPFIRIVKRDQKHFIKLLGYGPVWTLFISWGIPKRWAFWDRMTLKKMNRDKWFLEKGHHNC